MKFTKRKGIIITGIVLITGCLIAGTVFLLKRDDGKNQMRVKSEEAYKSFSASDRETADLYAELYETEREAVAQKQVKNKDWEKTGKELEKEFFTIPENIKYQMEKEGYGIADLEKAEKLSVKTGRKAIELAKAKGKVSDNRQWSDVVKDSEILSAEEQLGLSKEQIKQLKKKSLDREDRIEVAVLLINETYTFEEVIEELDAGKTVAELEEKIQ